MHKSRHNRNVKHVLVLSFEWVLEGLSSVVLGPFDGRGRSLLTAAADLDLCEIK